MTEATIASSTRPYLIRAIYDWCTDNGFTPYVAVMVDNSVRVPAEYVKDGEIVLNIGFDATSSLHLGNEFIEFKARFAGVAREIVVPINHVIAIYARENGQGMAFPAPASEPSATTETGQSPAVALSAVSKGKRSSPAPGTYKRVVQLAQVPSGESESPTEPPPAPSSPSNARPALKRVK
jgi:stringent starvation protein B